MQPSQVPAGLETQVFALLQSKYNFDVTHREDYLSDAGIHHTHTLYTTMHIIITHVWYICTIEFEVRFGGLSRAEFSSLPKWKQDAKKKAAGLF